MNLLTFALLAAFVAAVSLAPATVSGDGPSSYGSQDVPLVQDGELLVYGPGRIVVSDFPLTDHLGSRRDEDSEYAPFGSGGRRFAGHPYDYDVALYRTPSRVLDPSLGRFLSIDPNRQGPSPYAYAGNDPIGYLDPGGNIRTPFFMQSNMDPAYGYSTTHGVMDLLGAPKGMRVSHPGDFMTRFRVAKPRAGLTSIVGESIGRKMRGRLKGDAVYERTEEFYWIIGGSRDAPLPDELVPVLDKWGRMQGDPAILSKIVILDFTGKGVGKTNQGRLRAAGRDSLVIEANMRDITFEEGRKLTPTRFGVNVDGKTNVMSGPEFRTHIQSRIAAKTWQDSLPEMAPVQSGATRDIDSPPPRKKTRAAGSQPVPTTTEPETTATDTFTPGMSTEDFHGVFFNTIAPEGFER